MQRQFVTMVSHEFRTPLAIIDACAGRLMRMLKDASDDRLVDKVTKIRSAVTRMTKLIESTLNTDKAYAERLDLSLAPCPIRAIIDDVCERQRSISPHHHIDIDFGDAPETIVADQNQLDHIITNLLSNAVKYSPESERCSLRCRLDGDVFVMTVSDRGVGIPKDEIPNLFQRYFRASSAASIPGTGIGLNLVKKLVEMHGGAISVESELRQGSDFTVRLPVNGPEAGLSAAA
jgi:signal transduction histidine kinase